MSAKCAVSVDSLQSRGRQPHNSLALHTPRAAGGIRRHFVNRARGTSVRAKYGVGFVFGRKIRSLCFDRNSVTVM